MDLDLSRISSSDDCTTRTPLLIMTVEIGDGEKDNIVIYTNSIIETTVQDFSNKHNLTVDQEKMLLNQLKDHLQIENCEQNKFSRSEYFQKWNEHIDKHLAREPQHQPKINKKSIKIMQKREVRSVYERLYTFPDKTKKIQENPSLISKAKPTTIGIECGNRLYNNWIVRKEHLEKEQIKKHEQTEEEVTKILTFRPQINKNIPIFIHNQDSTLIQRAREETLERKRCELLAKEQDCCTFVPQINQFSSNLLQNKFKLSPKSKCLELYEEALIRKEKNEELVEH